MPSEYLWASPAGAYRVPDDFKTKFLAEFPEYRIRWSLKRGQWQIEQAAGRGALPPHRIDDSADDSLIRARDGYWLVMEFHPGSRMGCKALASRYPRQECGTTLPVHLRKSQEVICETCRRAGRDGRAQAAHWPFDEVLLDHLRFGDPLRGGTTRQKNASDAANRALEIEAARKASDAITSIDAVDHRWITGIASSSGLRRRTIDTRDLE